MVPTPSATMQSCRGEVDELFDGVTRAAGHRCGKGEGDLRADREIRATFVLQHQARAGKAGDCAADRVRGGKGGPELPPPHAVSAANAAAATPP
jgi:hypothetical protein